MKHVIPPHTLQRIVGALLILGVLTACSSGTDEAAVDIEALLGGQDSAPARPTEEVAVAEARPAETLHPTAAPETDQHCIDCHSNQELLTALATEAEPEESHSTGEG